jgi:hypothetical protein
MLPLSISEKEKLGKPKEEIGSLKMDLNICILMISKYNICKLNKCVLIISRYNICKLNICILVILKYNISNLNILLIHISYFRGHNIGVLFSICVFVGIPKRDEYLAFYLCYKKIHK